MSIEQLKSRREQVQTTLTQNHFTLQGHLNEIDFQIAELVKSKEAEIAKEAEEKALAEKENLTEDSNQTPVTTS